MIKRDALIRFSRQTLSCALSPEIFLAALLRIEKICAEKFLCRYLASTRIDFLKPRAGTTLAGGTALGNRFKIGLPARAKPTKSGKLDCPYRAGSHSTRTEGVGLRLRWPSPFRRVHFEALKQPSREPPHAA